MIEHKGVIKKIEGDHISVLILQHSACSGCHAKMICSASNMKEKIIDVKDHTGRFREGERVNIVGESSLGYKALFLAFIIPLLILLIVVMFCNHVWHLPETTSALVALAALLPYGLILYLLRDKLTRSLQFRIEKIESEKNIKNEFYS